MRQSNMNETAINSHKCSEYDDMTDFVNKLTEHDLINEVKYTLDDEMLEEFVKQIKGD